MTSLLAVWFEHETISTSQVFGGVLVLSGVVIVKLTKQKTQEIV
jgi:drug/metabolite transporter (DMT)-like permease